MNGVAGNVPDPRVKVKDAGKKANDGVTPLWQQQKFIARLGGTPIPIASWNEAQLIYAEAVGGQLGFDAINRVRTANGVPTLTGPAPTGQAFTDLVLEERRRQLFSEGQRYGDMLRYNLPFTKGTDAQGEHVQRSHVRAAAGRRDAQQPELQVVDEGTVAKTKRPHDSCGRFCVERRRRSARRSHRPRISRTRR